MNQPSPPISTTPKRRNPPSEARPGRKRRPSGARGGRVAGHRTGHHGDLQPL